MTTMASLLLLIGPLAAVVVAWALTRRYHEHRPTAVLLSILLGGILGQRALEVAVIAPLRAELGTAQPWTGWAWAAALANHAIEFVEPAALVGAALVVFVHRRAWGAVAAWVGAVAAYAVLHPLGADQMRFHVAADALGALTAAGLATSWWLRSSTDARASAPHAVTVIVLAELLSLPNAVGGPIPGWPTSQTLYMLLFGALVVMQAYATRREVAAVERQQAATEKGVLRANLWAESAVQTAVAADEKATTALDLAETVAPRSKRAPT